MVFLDPGVQDHHDLASAVDVDAVDGRGPHAVGADEWDALRERGPLRPIVVNRDNGVAQTPECLERIRAHLERHDGQPTAVVPDHAMTSAAQVVTDQRLDVGDGAPLAGARGDERRVELDEHTHGAVRNRELVQLMGDERRRIRRAAAGEGGEAQREHEERTREKSRS